MSALLFPPHSVCTLHLLVSVERDPLFTDLSSLVTIRQEQWPQTVNYHQLQAKVALVHYGLCVTQAQKAAWQLCDVCATMPVPSPACRSPHILCVPATIMVYFIPTWINYTHLHLNKLPTAFCAVPFHLMRLYLAGKGLMDWSPEVSVESLWAWQRWWGHSRLRNNKWFTAHGAKSAGLLWIHYLY